ncbi:MAG: hypothetical protein ACKO0Z_11635, partial [Betaproteobacteria bacterium]
GEIVSACIEFNYEASIKDLSDFLKGRIAGFKHPVRYYRVVSWPMTSSGKIRKRDLREMAASKTLELLV